MKKHEFAGGYIKTSEGVVKDRGVGAHLKRHAGAYTGMLVAPGLVGRLLGTGVGALVDAARKRPNIVKTSEMEPAVSDKTAALLRLRGPVLMSANLKPALRELAARSGRIVEFGDGEADEAVIAALKAAASADETPAQRAMLLKRGLIEMVKGQLVINERGYDLMKKAGMPPKLTPEERREEIAGTEEKRLSRFNHGEHGGHGVEFARGDNFRRVTKLVEHLAPGSGSMQVGGFGRWSQVPSFAAERGSGVASGQAGWLKVFRPKVKPTGQTMNVGGKVWYENAGEWPYRSASGLGLTKQNNALYTPEKRGF